MGSAVCDNCREMYETNTFRSYCPKCSDAIKSGDWDKFEEMKK